MFTRRTCCRLPIIVHKDIASKRRLNCDHGMQGGDVTIMGDHHKFPAGGIVWALLALGVVVVFTVSNTPTCSVTKRHSKLRRWLRKLWS